MVVVLSGLLLCLALPATAADRIEYQVKAAFLFNFARFASWPPARFSGDTDAIQFCVSDQDPLAPVLEAVLRGKQIGARPLRVRRGPGTASMHGCHVAYLGTGSDDRIAAALDGFAGRGVLTVHEGTQALAGGVIRFSIESQTVHFEINATAAEREQLELSSRLMSLASVVRR